MVNAFGCYGETRRFAVRSHCLERPAPSTHRLTSFGYLIVATVVRCVTVLLTVRQIRIVTRSCPSRPEQRIDSPQSAQFDAGRSVPSRIPRQIRLMRLCCERSLMREVLASRAASAPGLFVFRFVSGKALAAGGGFAGPFLAHRPLARCRSCKVSAIGLTPPRSPKPAGETSRFGPCEATSSPLKVRRLP